MRGNTTTAIVTASVENERLNEVVEDPTVAVNGWPSEEGNTEERPALQCFAWSLEPKVLRKADVTIKP